MLLSNNEVDYYARQLILDEVGTAGQLKLKNTKVLCIGAGGLGAPLLQYLTAAGIGQIGIIDHDVIESSNLSRQIIYKYRDIGKKKVIAAKEYLTELNPLISVNIYPYRFEHTNALGIIDNYDIIADGTDNITNRYITNHACVKLDKPFIFAGIWRYHGQCMLFNGKEGPCFNCLFPFDDELQNLSDCNNAGVLGVIPGMLGIMQANLIIRHILQINDHKKNTLFALNGQNFELLTYQVERDKHCLVCAIHQDITQLLPSSYHTPDKNNSISFASMHSKIEKADKFTLLDVRSEKEHVAYNLGGILIPLPELENRFNELDKRLPIIVYCQSGRRSQMAAAMLIKHGFASVLTLDHQF